MTMKHKQQSSLLNFFAKPKRPVSSAACSNINNDKHGENKFDGDNTTNECDMNDPVIGPCSPYVDKEMKKPFDSSTVISPPATIEALAVARQHGLRFKTTDNDYKNASASVSTDDGPPATIEQTPSNQSESDSDSDESSSYAPKKSEYELLRERNIARNNARLKSLGLLTEVHGNTVQSVKKTNHIKRKKALGALEVVSYPTRRSTRRRNIVLNNGQGADDSNQEMVKLDGFACVEILEPEENVTEDFTVSPLFEYNMSNDEEFTDDASTDVKNTGAVCSSRTLAPFGPRLIPPSGLNSIYSLQIYPDAWDNMRNNDHQISYVRRNPSWLAGAGKSGIVALWDCRRQNIKHDNQGIEPILSWKAHGGRWIADARFLPNSSCSTSLNENSTIHVPSRLLTAANDGTICHWDLASISVKTGAPKLLGQTSKSLHSSGIFSMDVRVEKTSDVIIASGSKDKTIALSTVERYGDAIWKSDFHSAKVGSVSLSAYSIHSMILSASDDGLVAVHDPRMNGRGDSSNVVAVKIEDSHTKPHSAVWRPGSDNIFLTAGLDDVIKLWDSRNVTSPLASFHGHVPGNGKKIKRINRPVFMTLPAMVNAPSESFILSGGEGSRSLSMFQLDNIRENGTLHSVLSRGKLPPDTGDIGCLAAKNGNVAVAVEGGDVLLLSQKV
ncbi:hypothetical protein ACHAWX_005298 [Stephanocyclus meneghinianus]